LPLRALPLALDSHSTTRAINVAAVAAMVGVDSAYALIVVHNYRSAR
jgi:hypothetical protein